MNQPPAKPTVEMVTLKQLCTELKLDPREARERLRLASRDAKKNPELAKSHKPGLPGSGQRAHQHSRKCALH
jgi:hypothetical protein